MTLLALVQRDQLVRVLNCEVITMFQPETPMATLIKYLNHCNCLAK